MILSHTPYSIILQSIRNRKLPEILVSARGQVSERQQKEQNNSQSDKKDFRKHLIIKICLDNKDTIQI